VKLAENSGTIYNNPAGFLCGNPRAIDHFEEPDLDGKIILRWLLRKWGVSVWTGSIWFRIGTGDPHL
jgi:hypothetical protein